jgi:uncharacterized protein YndB with AHSA1/START domain
VSQPVHVIILRRFEAPAERVFDACLDPAWVDRWMFRPAVHDAPWERRTLEARVGGRYSLVTHRAGTAVERTGEYLAIDRPRLLVFTAAAGDGRDGSSRVILEFVPRGDGCDVKLTHVLGSGWSAEIDRAARLWSRRLDRLQRAIAAAAAARI